MSFYKALQEPALQADETLIADMLRDLLVAAPSDSMNRNIGTVGLLPTTSRWRRRWPAPR